MEIASIHPGPTAAPPVRRGLVVSLVGMMGCGKTCVGRKLAARLGLPFVDADAEIEAAAGMPVPEIFELKGEAAFREGERRVIARILADGGAGVLATGGGAFMDASTRERIAEAGISIWLKAPPEVLMERVRRRSDRPLLRTPDPEATLRSLLAAREPVYASADIVVDSVEADVAVRQAIVGISAILVARKSQRMAQEHRS